MATDNPIGLVLIDYHHANGETGEQEFAAGSFAEVRRIVVPSHRFDFAHVVLIFGILAGDARCQHLDDEGG